MPPDVVFPAATPLPTDWLAWVTDDESWTAAATAVAVRAGRVGVGVGEGPGVGEGVGVGVTSPTITWRLPSGCSFTWVAWTVRSADTGGGTPTVTPVSVIVDCPLATPSKVIVAIVPGPDGPALDVAPAPVTGPPKMEMPPAE